MLIETLRDLIAAECAKTSMTAAFFPQHILVMADYAQKLAEHYGADQEIVQISAYLHDIAFVRDPNTRAEHHILGAEIAARILSDKGYPEDKALLVKQCILTHSEPRPVGQDPIEAVCVSNADAMSQIARPAFWLYYFYGYWQYGYGEGKQAYVQWIEENWRGLVEPARESIAEKYRLVKAALAEG